MNPCRALVTVPEPNQQEGADITYRLAVTQDELEQAFRLVWNEYVRVGLEKTGKQGLRLTKYHLLPEAKIFVAVVRSEDGSDHVVGTITIVPDGIFGLPAETVASDQIAELRREGQRAAEFVALACNEEGTKQRVILKLFRLAFEFCRHRGYTAILASLTERHIGFYRRFLSFRPLGKLKPYAMGNGTPVQVHCLLMEATAALVERRAVAMERDPNWRSFWRRDAGKLLAEAVAARPWGQDVLAYFLKRSSDLAQQMDVRTIQSLKAEYRRYGWHFAG